MSVLRAALARLTNFLTRHRADTRLDEEIQSHLDALADEYARRGLSPDEARRAARRAFGGVTQVKEAHQDQRRWAFLGAFDALARDGRRAIRRLFAAPAATLFSIATLATAIGVTTATYSVLIALLGDVPREIRAPASLVSLTGTNGGITWTASASFSDYRDLRDEQQSLTSVAASSRFSTSLVARGSSSLVTGELVTGTFFQTLGMTARLGRVIGPDDDRPDAPPVVMLSDTTWRVRFGSDPSVVGSTISLAGHPFTVIGVGAPGFSGLRAMSLRDYVSAAAWVPLSFADDVMGRFGPGAASSNTNRLFRLQVIGRLKTGVTIRQASDDIALIGQRLDRERSLPSPRSWVVASTFDQSQVNETRVRRLILSLPALVLLVACTNVTNLALSRGLSRRRTFAVRRALGASRWRVVREEVIEGAIVAAIGGVAALGVARLLLTVGVDSASGPAAVIAGPLLTLDFPLSDAVLLFTAGATMLALIVGTLAPALELSRTSVAHALGRDADAATPRWRGRGNLIALQVGASVGLFLVAFAAVTSLKRTALAANVPTLARVAAAGIPFDAQQYDETRARAATDRTMMELRRIPGIVAVDVVSGLRGTTDLFRSYARYAVSAIDRPFAHDGDGLSVGATIASPGLFQMVSWPMVSGRTFDDTDTASSERVVIVNEVFARASPDVAGTPGQLLYVQRQSPLDPANVSISTARIVGIVDDGARDGHDGRIYLPFAQAYDANVLILAEGAAGAPPPVDALRTALRRADPSLATQFVVPGPTVTDAVPRLLTFVSAAASGLAALALIFAMTGLSGVLSHVVAQGTREMAIRVSLGADRRRIAAMVLKDGLRPVAEGLVIGLGAAIVIRKLLQLTIARDMSSVDLVAFGVATIVLLAAALTACWLPTRHATRVDPNTALREL